MTQPLDRSCRLPALGAIDDDAGEFWVENPFQMVPQGHNLSAYERNCVFLNYDGHSFLDISRFSGADLDADSRSVVAADFDRDGAPDLLVGSVGGGPLRLFLNRFPRDNHRVRLHLIGTRSNRAAIGTRVIAHCGDRRIVRDVFAANGHHGQGPPELILGVGMAQKIDRLIVRWPSGDVQEFANLAVDTLVTITEGQPKPTIQPNSSLATER